MALCFGLNGQQCWRFAFAECCDLGGELGHLDAGA
jgi:hypothetical protein